MAFLRPSADDVDGLWLNESGNNTNLYASLDETTAGDTDYIVSPNDPVNEVCRIALSDPTGTLAEPFVLRYRFNNIAGAELQVRLVQGASTEIAVWTESGSGWTTSVQTLTSPQFAAITDFTDLFVEFSANYSAGDPTLVFDLDFTTTAETGLDSRVTFSRTTPATYVNASGLIATAVTNLMPRSTDMNNYVTGTTDAGKWTRGDSSVTIGAAVAGPDGSMTGRTINVGTHPTEAVFYQAFSGIIAPGGTYTLSVWAKRSASGSANKFRTTTNNTLSWNTGISQKHTLTDSWVRYTMTGAISTGSAAAVSICDRRQVDGSYDSDTDLNGNVDFWGPQLEQAPAAGIYFPTNSGVNTNYGPRFDYDPSTLTARGLLIEEQRANYVLRSQNFADAAWAVVGCTKVGVAPVADPMGGSDAYSITFNSTGGAIGSASAIYQAHVIPVGLPGSASFYLRSPSGTKTVRVGYFNGGSDYGTADTTIYDDRWTRVELPNVAYGSQNIHINVRNNVAGTTGTVYVFGAQSEIGAFATSYIPTTTAAVARAADVALMTGTNFSSWWNASAGTFVAAFDGPANGTWPIFAVDDNTANEVIMLYGSGTDPKAIVTDGGATQADLDAGTIAAGTAAKLGLSFAGNDFAACLNGGTMALDTGGTLPTVTQARIGLGPAGNYLNGHLASLKFYNVAKTDVELQALTT